MVKHALVHSTHHQTLQLRTHHSHPHRISTFWSHTNMTSQLLLHKLLANDKTSTNLHSIKVLRCLPFIHNGITLVTRWSYTTHGTCPYTDSQCNVPDAFIKLDTALRPLAVQLLHHIYHEHHHIYKHLITQVVTNITPLYNLLGHNHHIPHIPVYILYMHTSI